MSNVNFEVSNPPPFDTLGLFTFLRTYARRHKESDPKSTVESWKESLERVISSCNNQLKVNFSVEEQKEVFDLLYNLKFSVAGRFLWQLGTNTVGKLGLPSLQNCAFCVINEPIKPFTWAMNLLMLGAGIGYRVLPEDIKDLPQVKYALNTRKDTGDADFIVPDSREGWIKLLGKVLKSHFYSGKSFTYSCINLRSKGAPIKSFGGLASGPDVLCDGMSKIDDIMNKRAGMQMRPIDLLDVMNVIGMVVVSGNVRRSAQICIGDCKDVEYLRAKRWDLGNIPNYRAYSNNSVVCNDINEVLNNNDFWEGYQGNGEPYGLINLKLSQSCGRLGETKYPDPDVAGFNPCLSGDTLILTSEGLQKVENLVGKQFTAIVNGESHLSTDVGFWKTGERDVFKIKLRNGLEVRATSNHKFAVSLGRGIYRWEEVDNMKVGEKLVLCDNDGYAWEDVKETFDEGYFVGQLIGNGTFFINKQGKEQPVISLWIDDNIGISNYQPAKILLRFADTLIKRKDAFGFTVGRKNNGYTEYRMKLASFRNIVEKYNIRKNSKEVYEQGSYNFSKGLLMGFFDTDGSVQGNQQKGVSVRLTQSDLGRLKSVQRLLLSMGIFSTIYENRSTEQYKLLPDGNGNKSEYLCKAVHELIITKDSILKFSKYIGFSDNKKSQRLSQLLSSYRRNPYKTNFVSEIVSITPDGNEDVYDCTINDVHCFSANGILSHNCAEQSLNNYETCCLSEIYLPNITSKEELYKCASYAYRICKHSLTLPFHDSPETERIVHKNMRMGIGVTGYLQSTEEQKGWLSDCYNYLRDYDNQYSIQHGFPKSIKISTCKPSGTLSILGNCTPGVHPGFAKFYKRRVRISSESPLIAIAKAHGYHVEYVQNFDGTYDHGTQIVTFPMRLPDHTIFAENCSAIDQLEWVKKLQTDWSDNSVSVTVYYRKNELPAIKEWLRNNYNNSVKTVSFLLHSDHGFNQAPMEAITEEEYNRLTSSCRPITDLNGVCYSNDDDEMMNNEKDCAGGACPRK